MRERADACAWTKTIRKVRANAVSPPRERAGVAVLGGKTYGNLARNWITYNWPGEFKIYFRWCDSASLRGTAISPAARLTACSLRAQVDDGNPISVIRVCHCLGRYAGWLEARANSGEFRSRRNSWEPPNDDLSPQLKRSSIRELKNTWKKERVCI